MQTKVAEEFIASAENINIDLKNSQNSEVDNHIDNITASLIEILTGPHAVMRGNL